MQPEFVNYNVRVYSIKDEQRGWCREQKIPFRVFVNYDGSGYNFHIVEFQELEHAHAFMKHFNITGDRRLWAEDGGGDIHYLDSPSPADTTSPAGWGSDPTVQQLQKMGLPVTKANWLTLNYGSEEEIEDSDPETAGMLARMFPDE